MLRLGHRVVAEAILEPGDLGAHVEQRLEGEPGLLAQRAAGVMEAVLRQVADRQRGGLDDQAAVRLVEAGEHLEQGGLAGAVRAAQADPFAVVDLPVDRVEQDTVAKRLAECGELDHCVVRTGARGRGDPRPGPARDALNL